ncbi:ThuA domain-containing protein [Kribbella sp. CA-293567]|uniref:ThuA domain-containing protein n=1 Tax=Kribbella sp. CA-293567 TaxID=3002436 RepID=UPI0022DD7838|nr:ThuA domain-containing protein [Kribbella sp. CA-293567]WBQ03129.1 ThuA domain-containing protein [Kribbella sp. CA-293567]
MTTRRALVVRGGWEGHVPVEATELFIPFLRQNGFEVTVSDSPESYLDLDGTDLVLQCVTMSEITAEQVKGLEAAVRAGTGLAGWHGGIIDSFRSNTDYSFMTGGQFVSHPGGAVDHRIDIVSGHPIVEGLTAFDLRTEQYYVHADPTNNVLATTTFDAHPDFPWIVGATMPAVWTRGWGEGRVFVCTPGHTVADLETPQIRTIVERGLLWASK